MIGILESAAGLALIGMFLLGAFISGAAVWISKEFRIAQLELELKKTNNYIEVLEAADKAVADAYKSIATTEREKEKA